MYTQKLDINGKPTLADRIWDGYTDNGGFAEVALTKGMYAIKIGDNVLYDVPIEWGRITTSDGQSVEME